MPVQLGRPVRLYGGFFPFFVPGNPTSVQAFPGAAQALVSWTAPAINGGTPITGYTVTASPGGAQVVTTGATVATIAGLTNGTAYTFTVTAANAVGSSPPSTPSAAVTPVDVPGAPTGVIATAGNGQVTLTWTAPASNGGSAITDYTATVSPGGRVANVFSASPTMIVGGLTDGTTYTFTVNAINSVGTGPASASSNAATPAALSQQPGPNSPGAPAIPDGVWPMGYQGYVKGVLQPGYVQGGSSGLQVLNRDWNFATDGFDLSGWEIHGKVVWPAASGTGPNVGGDGFIIRGAGGAGTSASALLDTNTHFTQTFPTFQNFTILPTVPVVSTNGWMGNECTIFNADISGMGGDTISPNNLNNGGRPLNLNIDWVYCHDLVYYLNDGGSHIDGTHNDNVQDVGGTTCTITRAYLTGCADPTKGDGAYLRSHGRNAGTFANIPCPDGQQNSAVQLTQNVSHVDVTFDRCRFGGGAYASVNLTGSGGGTTNLNVTITNSLFDGNNLSGNDIGGDNSSSPGTTLVQSGNKRVDGSAIKITRVVA